MQAASYNVGQTVKNAHSSGFYFDSETLDAVKAAIVSAHASRARVRIFYGSAVTGESWHEEFDIVGTIGRSMGPCRVPLLIADRRGYGHALLDACIVAMFDTQTGRAIYRHPQFNPGAWSTGPAESAGYVEAAFCNGKLHAQFKKPGAAVRYCGFMRGDRFSK